MCVRRRTTCKRGGLTLSHGWPHHTHEDEVPCIGKRTKCIINLMHFEVASQTDRPSQARFRISYNRKLWQKDECQADDIIEEGCEIFMLKMFGRQTVCYGIACSEGVGGGVGACIVAYLYAIDCVAIFELCCKMFELSHTQTDTLTHTWMASMNAWFVVKAF